VEDLLIRAKHLFVAATVQSSGSPSVIARSERSGSDDGSEQGRPRPGWPHGGLLGLPGRPSIQACAALASGVCQQAFKKETDIGVACVIPAGATPTSKIPIEGSGSSDEVRKGCVKRAREVRHALGCVTVSVRCYEHAGHGENVRLADGVTEPTLTTF
jgi:hypothetical protein